MELNELTAARATEYYVTIAGDKIKVSGDMGVVTGLKDMLGARGITSFSIVLDGRVLTSTEDLYEDGQELTFSEIGDIAVERNVKGGSR